MTSQEYEDGMADAHGDVDAMLGVSTTRIQSLERELALVTDQRDKAWRLAEHREKNVELERKLIDDLAATTAVCNRLREFEVTAQTADEELAETKGLLDRLEAMTAERDELLRAKKEAEDFVSGFDIVCCNGKKHEPSETNTQGCLFCRLDAITAERDAALKQVFDVRVDAGKRDILWEKRVTAMAEAKNKAVKELKLLLHGPHDSICACMDVPPSECSCGKTRLRQLTADL